MHEESLSKRKVVLDIDGILWSMAEPWHKEIYKINPECPYPGKSVWAFYKGYLTDEEIHRTIKNVHMNQLSFNCFTEAPTLSSFLKSYGFHTTIASHRDPECYDVTKKWLDNNYILYDDLYVGPDKHPLLKDSTLLIDDCPDTQNLAIQQGVPVFSLVYPYNKDVKNVRFYNRLSTMMFGIKKYLHRRGIYE